MSTVLLLQLAGLALRLLAGGSLGSADVPLIQTALQQLLTPANLRAAADFFAKHSGQVEFVIHKGLLWIVKTGHPAPDDTWLLNVANPTGDYLALGVMVAGYGALPEDSPVYQGG